MQNHQKRQKYQKGKTQQYPNQASEKSEFNFADILHDQSVGNTGNLKQCCKARGCNSHTY